MIVKKALNNNAVMSEDETGNEIIVKGKGIAYNKKNGDQIDKTKIDKIFVLNNKEASCRYQEILKHIPDDCIEACEQMIDVIKESIHKDISDKIYVTLTDHVFNLLERVKMGIVFDNALLWDVKRLYKEEYQVGQQIVEMIRKAFDIKIKDDEAGFIALHIVNAEINCDFKDVIEVTSMIEDVYEIVASYFALDVDKDSLEYTRFIMHLRVFFERILNKRNITYEKSKKLLDTLSEEYQEQYKCTQKILHYVTMKYDTPLEGEILYLLIHIIKLTDHG